MGGCGGLQEVMVLFRRRLWWSLGAVMPPEQNGQAPQRAGAEEGGRVRVLPSQLNLCFCQPQRWSFWCFKLFWPSLGIPAPAAALSGSSGSSTSGASGARLGTAMLPLASPTSLRVKPSSTPLPVPGSRTESGIRAAGTKTGRKGAGRACATLC